ncbi:ALDH-like protein [Lophium mytilinum]|uniref:ALDH-like protein n=1 Tax=Lophium mytilinum TaxID=390894 RepID=A0A6A6R8E5_9PEZI|nr:ALDH-like protein [Lophium mytilinum]
MPGPLQRIREAAIDGRCQNVIYRQTQLEKLHNVLIDNSESVIQAIYRDGGNSIPEARVEYLLALMCLREYYASLDATKALHEEYAVARGEDAPSLREGVGIVYIVPTTYSLFYSIVVPLSAAVAAGNCVVIELEKTLREVPSLLQRILKIALDSDIFEIVSSRATDDELGLHHMKVLQRGSEEPATAMRLISPSQAQVVAVVDRTANFSEAAKALVIARFGFGGRSPYAPDIVLVNEFCKKPFLNAVVEETMKFATEFELSKSSASTSQSEADSLMKELKRTDEIQVVTSIANCAVIEVNSRSSKTLSRKISTRSLLVHSVKSLDDAIDLANQNGELLASYVFADLKASKYLSQFLGAHVSFVNQIPLEMLRESASIVMSSTTMTSLVVLTTFVVGPAAPLSSPVERSTRYPTALFTVQRSRFVTPSVQSQLVRQTLHDPSFSASEKVLQKVSDKLLPSVKRMKEGQVGFFEQGIFTGIGLIAMPALMGLGALGYYAVRFAMSRRS